jgi:hypothetical protein
MDSPQSKTVFHDDRQGIKLMYITYENLFPPSQGTHCASIRKTNVFLVFREKSMLILITERRVEIYYGRKMKRF